MMMGHLTHTQTLASLHGQEEKPYAAHHCLGSGMLSQSRGNPITTFARHENRISPRPDFDL